MIDHQTRKEDPGNAMLIAELQELEEVKNLVTKGQRWA